MKAPDPASFKACVMFFPGSYSGLLFRVTIQDLALRRRYSHRSWEGVWI